MPISASEDRGGTPIALLLLHECVGETMPREFDWRSFGKTVTKADGSVSKLEASYCSPCSPLPELKSHLVPV